jgi:Transmembrane secretion effector
MGIAMEQAEGVPLTSFPTSGNPNKPQLRSDDSSSFSSTDDDDEETSENKALHDLDLERSDADWAQDNSHGDDDDEEEPEKNQGMMATTSLSGYFKLLWEDVVSYIMLLWTNRPFRLFLASYVFGHMGEWFTYIASISLMERMLGPDSSNSRTSIGVLVMIRLLPTVVLSPFGGVLADSHDRRKSMIILDLCGAVTPLFFILATVLESHASPYYGIAMIYFATICQECVCALYEPCRTSIVPLLVTGNDNDLKKATTLTGVAWSAVAAFGSALGGFATSYFGARTCFCKYLR